MSEKEKIGVGIVSFNRKELFEKCFKSMPPGIDTYLSITGQPYEHSLYKGAKDLFEFEKPACVGKGKNKLLEMMVRDNCKHIFLVEDDMQIIDANVFDTYIRHGQETGIIHLNYAFHGPGNKKDGVKKHRSIITYNDKIKISLNTNCIGAFSYYDRRVINTVGYIDEYFNNCWDHVEHTYRIIKAGMTTPFWWFADIAESDHYITDNDCRLENSVIRRNGDEWNRNLVDGLNYFQKKHGCNPHTITNPDIQEVIKSLKELNSRWKVK